MNNSSVEQAVLSRFASAVAAVATCPVDQCKFVHVRNIGHVMQVDYQWKDSCCRCRSASAYIDIKDICFEDLCDPGWINYLHSLAVSFEKSICIRPVPACRIPNKRCFQDQPHWSPYPCTITRFVELPPVVCKPKCATIIQTVTRVCECVSQCPVCPYGVEESYVPDLCCDREPDCHKRDRKPDCDRKYDCRDKDTRPQYFDRVPEEWRREQYTPVSRQSVGCNC